jgi:hypothetical protein
VGLPAKARSSLLEALKTIRENPRQTIATSPIDEEEGDDIFILRVIKRALGNSRSPSLERPWFALKIGKHEYSNRQKSSRGRRPGARIDQDVW